MCIRDRWIRQAITRAIADQARTIRIPVHMVETINKAVSYTHLDVYKRQVLMAGQHQDFGNDYPIIEPTVGGWGACRGHDGQVGQFCVGDGETYNVPVEMAETLSLIHI